jgi:hypothetical protein
MLKNLIEAKEYVESQGVPGAIRHEHARNLTLISFVIKDAYDLLAAQLEKVGYNGLHLLDRIEFCLKSTTQSCSDGQFSELVHLLESADRGFKETKLYVALCIIRSMCGGSIENSVLEYIVMPVGKTKAEFLDIIADLHFFSGFLVETLIRQLHIMKTNMKNTRIDSGQIKELLDERFEDIVVDLVQKISGL